MSRDSQSQPLVSVGIPTYNRPRSLRHTLACLTRQTYRNLEIIVSDNASPDGEVGAVVREFMAVDSRIRYHRQPENLGIVPNYQFVLAQASGEFFMWAADDDEWDPSFVAHCVANIGRATSYMPGYRFLFTQSGKEYPPPPVRLAPGHSRSEAMRLFFATWYVHILYALHRRSSIQFVLSDPVLDYYDTYFCIRILIEGEVVVDPSSCLFTVIVETAEYENKPLVKPHHKIAGYRNALVLVAGVFLRTPHLRFGQKLEFTCQWFRIVLAEFSSREKAAHPAIATLVRVALLATSIPGRVQRWVTASMGGRPS